MKNSLGKWDWIKGFILGVGTPVLYLLQGLIPGWNIDPILKVALSATATYLIKNYFTDDVKVAQRVIADAQKREAANIGNTLPMVLLMVALFFSSCGTTGHIATPVKNPAMLVYVQDGRRITHDLYIKMMESTNKNYQTYEEDYKAVEVYCDSVKSFNSTRKNAHKMYLQTVYLKEYVSGADSTHKHRRVLNNGQLLTYSKYADGFWKALLISEESNK